MDPKTSPEWMASLEYQRIMETWLRHQKKNARWWAKDRRDNPAKYMNPAKRRLVQLCDQCDRRFRTSDTFDPNAPKASQCLTRCASDIAFCPLLGRWFVFGGYGSLVLDNGTLEVVQPSAMPRPLDGDQVLCDYCIKDLVAKGVLQAVIDTEGEWVGDPVWQDEYWIIRHRYWTVLEKETPEEIRLWFRNRSLDELKIRRVDR